MTTTDTPADTQQEIGDTPPPARDEIANRKPDSQIPAITKIPAVPKELAEIADLADETGQLMQAVQHGIAVQFQVAQGVMLMREQLSKPGVMKKYVMPLIGTALGFRTDRDVDSKKAPYSEAEIADIVIETFTRGGRIVGNEITVISGRPHFNVEFFRRTVFDIPGFDNMFITKGLPGPTAGGSAPVAVRIEFTLNGQPGFQEGTYPANVVGNQMQTATQTKAERLALQDLKRSLMGATFSPEDADADTALRIGSGTVPEGAFSSLSVTGAGGDEGADPTTQSGAIEALRKAIGESGVDDLDAKALVQAHTFAGRADFGWDAVPLSIYLDLRTWVRVEITTARGEAAKAKKS